MADIQFDTWELLITKYNIPLREELRAVYDASSPFQAESLAAMLFSVSNYPDLETLDKHNNFYGLHNEGSFYGLTYYSDCVTATEDWMARCEYQRWVPSAATQPNDVAQTTASLILFDQRERAEPEPVPEDVAQPMETDLRFWFCSNTSLEVENDVYLIWKGICQLTNRYPELTKVTEDKRGRVFHFENGLKIFMFGDRSGVMNHNKDRL